MSQVKHSFYNYSFILSTYILMLFSGLFSTVLLARFLGPEKYGSYNLFLLVANALLLIGSTWIINPAGGKFATEEFAKHKSLKNTFSSEVIIIAVSLSVMAGIVYLFRSKIVSFLGFNEGFVISAILLYAVFFSMFGLLTQCFLGASDFKSYGIMPLVRSLIFLGLLIFCSVSKYAFGLKAVITFLVVSYFLTGLFYVRLRNSCSFVIQKSVKIQIKKILRFSWPVVVFACANFSLEWIDKYFVKIFLSTYAVGIYSAAWMLTRQFSMIAQLLYSVLLPIITSYRVNNKRGHVRYYLKRLVPQLSFLFSVLIITVVVFSNPMITLLYGKAYATSVNIFILLSLGSIFMAIKYFYNPVSTSFNYIKLTGSINLFCAFLNIGFIYLLIPKFGAEGAALATTLSSFLAATGVIFVINKKFDLVNFRPLFCCIPAMVIGVACILTDNIMLRLGVMAVALFVARMIFKKYEIFRQDDLKFIEKIHMPVWLRTGAKKFYRIF